MPFPQFVTVGVSYRPDPNWNFEANVDWTDWDRVEHATLAKASGNIPVRFNWISSYIYEAGITRFLTGGWFVSGGYFFTEASTPEADFTPLAPDTDFHVGSLGFGRRGARWSWATAYQIMKGPERPINNGSPATGTFQFSNQAFVASLGYRF